MKKFRILKLICLILLTFTISLTLFACGKGDLTFNTNLNANIETTYDPQIRVKNGKIISVELRDEDGVLIELGDKYLFKPVKFGKYYYNITVEMDKQIQQFVKAVTVSDTLAPEVLQVPSTKTVEVGVYRDFENDLANILVNDNDSYSEKWITKKVISIIGAGKNLENLDGFSEVLLDKVGNYTLKVEVKDVWGNATFTEYTINTVDTTAPVINAQPFSYAWLDTDGKVTLPEADINDFSNIQVTTSASIGGQSVTITDGTVNASVSDEIEVTYQAVDEYENVATKAIIVKVLETGKLMDNADSEIVNLFTAINGIIEYQDGLLISNDGITDQIYFNSGANICDSVADFGGLSFEAINYRYYPVTVIVMAKVGYESLTVGEFTLPANKENATTTTVAIDLTKSGLNKVDGWVFAINSDDALNLVIKNVELTAFANPFVDVITNETATLGDLLTYDVNGGEPFIYKTTVTIKKGENVISTLNAFEPFIFNEVGVYNLTFSFDLGSRIFTTTKRITVSGSDISVSVDGEFVGGRVNEEYTLPTVQAGDMPLSVAINSPSGNVQVTDGKFTPTISGNYTATYTGAGVKETTFNFYIESQNEISFETQNSFNFSGNYAGGFESVKGINCAKGNTLAKAVVKAKSFVGSIWQTPYTINGQINAVNVKIYANLDGGAKIGFMVDDDSEVVYGSNLNLVKGENTVTFLLTNTTTEKWENTKIKGIFIYNQSAFDNEYYIDEISFIDKQSVTQSEVYVQNIDEVYAQSGRVLIVPNVIACDNKLVESVSVQIISVENNQVVYECLVGERIELIPSKFVVGEYKINYVTSIFGNNYEKMIDLTVAEASLKASIKFTENFYTDTPFFLPKPILSSGSHSQDQLDNALINKYYRVENGQVWLDGNGEIRIENSATIEIKYLIRIGDEIVVTSASTFVHEKGVHADFEQWYNGETYGFTSTLTGERMTTISSDWAMDGKNSLKIHAEDPWERPITSNLGMYAIQANLPSISFGYDADAIVLWVYSEYDFRDVTIQVDNNNEQWVTGKFSVKKGVNKQIITLDKTISEFKRIRFEVHGNEPYYIDHICFVKLAEISLPEIDSKQFDEGTGVFIKKPTFIPNPEFFTAEEIANALTKVVYEDKNGNQEKIIGADGVTLMMDAGEYDLTLICSVGGIDFNFVASVKIRQFVCEFVEPNMLINFGEEKTLTVVENLSQTATLTVQLRKVGGEWETLTLTDNKITLNFTLAGEYEIKYTATQGQLTEEETYLLLVRKPNSIADFEINEDGSHVLVGGTVNIKQGHISDAWSKDGKYSYRTKRVGDDFAWVRYMDSNLYSDAGGWQTVGQVDFDAPKNAMSAWINADFEMPNFSMEVLTRINGGLKWIKSVPQTIKGGVNKYVFRFEEEFTFMYAFGWITGTSVNYDAFYIDAVEVLKLENISFDLPENAIANQSYKFQAPNLIAVGTEVTDVNVYLVGETEDVLLEMVDGYYSFGVQDVGLITKTLKFVYTDIEGANIIYQVDKVISVRSFDCVFIEPRVVVNKGVQTQLTMTSVLESGATLSAKIRKVGETWQDLIVDGDKVTITLTESGEYEIKYIATKYGADEEEVFNLLVREPNVVADFELEADGAHVMQGGTVNLSQGYITDTWSKDGKYSYRIRRSGDDFAWVRFMDSNLYSDAGGWQTVGQLDFDAPKNAMSAWINADFEMPNFSIEVLTRINGGLKWIKSVPQTIMAGEHKYIFYYEEEFTFAYSVGWITGTSVNYDAFYIDAIKVCRIDSEGKLPEKATLGKELTFAPPEFNLVGLKQDTIKVYTVIGENEVEIVLNDGVYTLVPTEKGELTLKITIIDVDGACVTITKTLTVYEKANDPFVPDIEWEDTEEVKPVPNDPFVPDIDWIE